MTLAERLQMLMQTAAEAVGEDGNTARDALRDVRDGLQLLIADCQDKVLVKPNVYIVTDPEAIERLGGRRYTNYFSEYGISYHMTEAEALADLQQRADKAVVIGPAK